jgi:GPI mannosyltransferase 3
VAVILRPTNLFIWLTVLVMTLVRPTLKGQSPLTLQHFTVLAREIVLCGASFLGLAAISDCLFFGEWTLPAYKWLYFNIAQSLAVLYGRNDWHYYLSQGIPLLCTTCSPFVLYALYQNPSVASAKSSNTLKTLTASVCTTIIILSMISHKEVRFIYPLLPVLHILGAPYTASFFTSADLAKEASSQKAKTATSHRLARKPYLVAGLFVNFLLAGYLSVCHQRASITVLSFLRERYAATADSTSGLLPSKDRPSTLRDQEELFALFLMPCHTTPWRSHLVYPGLHARALTCEPPLHTQPNTPERDNYRDEADRFYDNPLKFLTSELWPVETPARGVLPQYLVGFEGIEPWIAEFFNTTRNGHSEVKLTRVWESWNGFFNEDWRRSGKMIVWDTGKKSFPDSNS